MMFKVTFFLLSLCLVAVTGSQTTPVKKCKKVTEDLFQTVTVHTEKGVCTELPCKLYSGKNVTADISFNIKDEVTQIIQKCNASAMGITIQYPVPNSKEGCDLLTNTFCPVEADSDVEFSLVFFVEKSFPQMQVDLVFFLLNQNEDMISCFELSARIVRERSEE